MSILIKKHIKLGLDVMGGDYAPESTILGAIEAQKVLPSHVRIALIGPEDIIKTSLIEKGIDVKQFDIIHAPDVIKMGEHPLKAYKQKPGSSIVVGFNLLKNKEIMAFSSAGNTGAMLVGSMYGISPINGIIRPCITSIIPRENGNDGVLLDVGSNPDCKPDVLQQFGLLGSLYAKNVLGIKNPRIGLLNIGEEEEKGSILTQAAYRLMTELNDDYNFIGNIEGHEIFSDKADVIVCDGFTGNVILKQLEGLYKTMLKRGINDDYFNRFNYENYGGTPILGVDASVIIGHGISNAKAIKNMILLSRNVYDAKLSKQIKRTLQGVHPILGKVIPFKKNK